MRIAIVYKTARAFLYTESYFILDFFSLAICKLLSLLIYYLCIFRMSRRQRTTQRKNVDPSVIEEARKLIADGKSKRQVAEQLGMPESTLRLRLKQESSPQSLGRYKCTFTPQMEGEMLDYIQKLDAMFYGITAKRLRVLAYDFAEKNKIAHQFNKQFKIAGRDWLRGFMKRNPSLALRQPTSTSVARAMGFNRPQVDRFYNNLMDLYNKYQFPPHKIFNMDESGFSTVPNKPPKVISTKGKRCVNKISSAERGQNVTVVCAMSAGGQFIPPTFIYKRKRMKAELLDNAPPSAIGMISDSSFITSDLFLHWLQHFKDHAMPTQEHPVLLILDNHSSHCTLAAIDFCRQNHIILLSLPPHSSHKIQPLDRCFFSPLKKYYAAECENWLRNHPGRTITTFQIAAIFTPAYAKTATIANAIEGFKVTGIWPFKSDIFSDIDFLASSITERPLGSEGFEMNAASPTVEDLVSQNVPTDLGTANNDNERQLLSIEEDILEEARKISEQELSDYEINQHLDVQSISSLPSTSSSVTLLELSPYPKSSTARPYSKRSKRSEILSSSPHKRILEEEAKKKSVKPLPKKNKTVKPKKPANAPKKKIWSCPGCSEVYIEPITEDWIECICCKEWWHDKCTAYVGHGNFQCDVCE